MSTSASPQSRGTLLLWGMMGSGKSTVGRAIAARTDARFVDLDALVEQQAGQSIANIFGDRGEAHFRTLEQQALSELLATDGPMVIALGGGTLLHRETRERALRETFVVCLSASLDTLLSRTAGSGRPLLKHDARSALRDLMKRRNNAYEQAHLRINTDSSGVEAIAEQVAGQWIGANVGTAAGAS